METQCVHMTIAQFGIYGVSLFYKGRISVNYHWAVYEQLEMEK